MAAVSAGRIVGEALAQGAALAGIAPAAALGRSPSYRAAGRAAGLPPGSSVLVLALPHPPDRPELDWWDGDAGTPGNRVLRLAIRGVSRWAADNWGVGCRDLPYHLEKGGVFLKDAAVLAGLGVIGRNNLLLTPRYGPRVRLRAALVERDLPAGGPLADFRPCEGCPAPCLAACPQSAFAAGAYRRPACQRQMAADEADRRVVEDARGRREEIRYCRRCELACPAGK